MVIPDEAGIGQAPQSFAKAASERIRSGLSPKMINSSAAVWAVVATVRDPEAALRVELQGRPKRGRGAFGVSIDRQE